MGTGLIVQALQSTGENTSQGMGSAVSVPNICAHLSFDASLNAQWLLNLSQLRSTAPACPWFSHYFIFYFMRQNCACGALLKKRLWMCVGVH